MPSKGGSKSQSPGTAAQGTSSGPDDAAGSPIGAAEPRFPLFYRSLTPIDAARHGGKSLKRRLGFDFARSSHAVLLNGSEFEAAARYYPIVFTPSPAAAALSVVRRALLSDRVHAVARSGRALGGRRAARP